MKTTIDETKLLEQIQKLEDKRDEHYKSSSEHIEIDEQINLILEIIKKCRVK